MYIQEHQLLVAQIFGIRTKQIRESAGTTTQKNLTGARLRLLPSNLKLANTETQFNLPKVWAHKPPDPPKWHCA